MQSTIVSCLVIIMFSLLLTIVDVVAVTAAYFQLPPPQNPPWEPTYNMLDSLISMQCNHSGFSSPERGSEFGIITYDWSNAKSVWAKAKPMTCEELLVEQVEKTKKAGGKHIFVYRNIVKALPWFQSVRIKLDDPNYEGFFLKFDPNKKPYHVPDCAPENHTHCSKFYHDQEQTPEVPTPNNEHPDGICNKHCDCGNYHPCGEYLFDHRNGTMLREWIINELILGRTSVGHSNIDGIFLDDFWCSNKLCELSQNLTSLGCPCNDPNQGPTEIDKYSQYDMNLSDQDIFDITIEWKKTMTIIQQTLLKHNAYTWSLMYGQQNANAEPILLHSNTCIKQLRNACMFNSMWQQYTMLFGFTVKNNTNLIQFDQDLAFFLLVRGPYTYAGWGIWGMTWPFNAEPSHGQLPPMPHGVPLPVEFYYDYGVPIDPICSETSQGIFSREWSKVSIELDCNTFHSNIIYKEKVNDEIQSTIIS